MTKRTRLDLHPRHLEGEQVLLRYSAMGALWGGSYISRYGDQYRATNGEVAVFCRTYAIAVEWLMTVGMKGTVQ